MNIFFSNVMVRIFKGKKKEYLFAKNCNFWYNWCEGFDWYIYNKLLPFLYIYLSLFPIYIHEERGLVLHLSKFKLKSKPKATLCKVFLSWLSGFENFITLSKMKNRRFLFSCKWNTTHYTISVPSTYHIFRKRWNPIKIEFQLKW